VAKIEYELIASEI